MTEPSSPEIHNVTHAFTLEHLDRSSGTQRELHVLVDDQQVTQLIFTNKQPGHETYATSVALTEIGLEMLAHALQELDGDLSKYARPAATH